jgi:peptidyl-prolyl cis-trans isomerase B (cyclophilin B)
MMRGMMRGDTVFARCGALLILLVGCGVACSSKPESVTDRQPVPESTPKPAVALATPNPAIVDEEQAVVETEFGKFTIRFYPDVAPRHVENFKKLTREKFYDGLAFHRVIPENLVQGGDPQTRNGKPEEWGKGIPGQPRVAAEFNTRPYVRGTIGMARLGGDPDSGTSQFFISLTEHPEWNGRYTVFGEVSEGLDVVSRISQVPSDPMSQRVERKIVMKRVYLEKAKLR